MSEDSDTRKLLGEGATSNYGSSSSLSSDRPPRSKTFGSGDRRYEFPWSQPFSQLLSLAAFWKRRKATPPNRRIVINNSEPQSRSFCSNRIRYIPGSTLREWRSEFIVEPSNPGRARIRNPDQWWGFLLFPGLEDVYGGTVDTVGASTVERLSLSWRLC
jgi:hypothetical protein